MRATSAAVVALALSFAACPAEPPPLPHEAPLVLDTVLGDGEVRCGPVTKTTELIGGPGAYGQVGRTYRCHNSRIRFLLQDGSRPVGNSSVGGNIIDADRVRPDEIADGRDSFRELVVAFGANEVDIEAIEVISDGRLSPVGVLRVRGRPGGLTIVPLANHLRQELPARVETDYILRPDVDYVEIRTRLINETDDFIGPVLYADFVTFGGERPMHSPERGFREMAGFERVSFLDIEGNDDVSYGYVCSDHDVMVPYSSGAITAPVCRDDRQVAIEDSYSRYLVVGDGSLESVARVAFALRGLAVGTASGVVVDESGAPRAGVAVSALSGGGPLDDDATVVNRARTDAEGRYTLTMRPGRYRLVAHVEGHARVDGGEVEIVETRDVIRDLALGGSGTLVVTTTFSTPGGADLGALPAKLSVLPQGESERPSGVLGELTKAGLARYRPSSDGRFAESLPPGRYRVFVTRGFEFTRYEADVELKAGEATRVYAALVHVVDTGGLVGTEFHQHTLASVDSSVPIAVKVLENAAEGVEFASSTDHDNVSDFRPYVKELGLEQHLVAVSGNEVTYTSIGHFNVYPWEIDDADPFKDAGSRVWWMKTIPELFADVRELAGGDPLIQINHPRSLGSGYFAALQLNPYDGTRHPRPPSALPSLPPTVYDDWTSAFDSVEVNGSLGSPESYTEEGWQALAELAASSPSDLPTFADWLGLMGAGVHVAALGNSDTHGRNGGVGYPRSFARVEKDAPASVTPDDMRAAIRAQRTAVGNGCLVELFVGDARPMGVGEAVAPAALDDLRVRVQAPPHVDVARLEIYVNGRVQPLSLDDEGVSLDAAGGLGVALGDEHEAPPAVELEAPVRGLPADRDLVVVALARGGESLAPTGDGHPFCYSAPLYVDEGGDGWVGWSEATQTVR